MLAFGNACHSLAVIFLVEEKACFLSVFNIYAVTDAVFNYFGYGIFVFHCFGRKPAFVFCHAFQFAYFYIVALINTADIFTAAAQNLYQHRENFFFAQFYAQRQSLRYQNIVKAVYRKAREHICLTKNKAAAFKIIARHYRAAVIDSILQTALPESCIEFIVGIGGNNAYFNFGIIVNKTRTKIFSFIGYNINQIAIGISSFDIGNFICIYPGMAASCGTLAFGGNIYFCVIAHKMLLCFLQILYNNAVK